MGCSWRQDYHGDYKSSYVHGDAVRTMPSPSIRLDGCEVRRIRDPICAAVARLQKLRHKLKGSVRMSSRGILPHLSSLYAEKATGEDLAFVLI